MLLFDSNYYSLALHTASDLCIIMDYKMRSLQVKTKEVREKKMGSENSALGNFISSLNIRLRFF